MSVISKNRDQALLELGKRLGFFDDTYYRIKEGYEPMGDDNHDYGCDGTKSLPFVDIGGDRAWYREAEE